MSYRFLDEIAVADIAFEVMAADLPALFSESAEALAKVQIDNPDAIRREQTLEIKLSHEQLDLLLYRFLQELIYYKDAKRLLLLADKVSVEQKDRLNHLTAKVAGETLDPERHRQRVDVKAATLHKLEVRQTGAGWKATVVLDI